MDFEVSYPTKVFVAALRNVATLPHAALRHCTPQCCYVTARSITSLHSAVLLRYHTHLYVTALRSVATLPYAFKSLHSAVLLRYHTQLYVTALRSVATLPHAALRHCTPQCCYVTTRSFTSLHSAVLLRYHTQLFVTVYLRTYFLCLIKLSSKIFLTVSTLKFVSRSGVHSTLQDSDWITSPSL